LYLTGSHSPKVATNKGLIVLKKAQQLISRTAGYNSLGWESTVKVLESLIRKYQSKQDKSQFQKADLILLIR